MQFDWNSIVARLFASSKSQKRTASRPRSRRLELESLEERVVPAFYDGLTMPDTGIRLLFNSASLAQAKKWYAANPFTPASDDALGNAFVYQMTGKTTYAQNAITQLMGFTISQSELDGVASDTYRWNPWVPIVFDWCADQMTASQSSTFIARYNNYTSTLIAKSWGGPTMPSNNYFWSYWSNELDWGIATYGRNNPSAATFIDDAVKTRWNAFTTWANTTGNGGIPQEGTQYGRYMLEYPVVALTTAANDGLNLARQTSFFQDAAYYLLYSTSPMPVATKSSGSFQQVFPFNDDEASFGNPPANDTYYADFMTLVAQQFSGTPLGGYARQWMATVGATPDYWMAAIDAGGSGQAYSGLPTDYYAPGPGYLYAKDTWGSSAMSAFLQLGGLDGVGHSHEDMGAFQILQNGQWLTKQTTGYASSITGFNGQGTVGVDDTLATNGVYVGGLGEASSYANGNPTVTRLESQLYYTFASVDLTQAYLSSDSRFNNPNVKSVVRDFIFVRPLNVMVVLDRVATTSASAPVTFLLHFPNQPTIQGSNSVLGTNGNQALQLTTLTPSGQSAPTLKVVNDAPANPDSSTDYQYRLEESYTGQTQSYMINVLQGRTTTGPQVTATMTEDSTSFTVTLKDPSGRTAVIKLQKGATSTGGSFGYSTSGSATLNNLATGVEPIQVSPNGVVWGTSGVASFSVSAPATSVAGTSFNVTVKALDSSGNVYTGYTGTVHFTSTDGQAALPPDYAYTAADAGVHTFTVTLKSAGSDSITANDTASGSVSGSAAVSVTPAAASVFALTGYPSPTVAGAAHNFTLKALDAYGNQASGYAGTVHFTSSDAGAALPGDYTFTPTDAGAHTFSATLNTVATQSLTATDTQNSSLTATQSGIVVNPASLSFNVSAPSSSVAGNSFNVTVKAVDSSGNVYTGYRGTVHFTSTDGQAVLPADYTYAAADAGVHVFSVTLKTAGSDSITVTDTTSSSIVGSAPVSVTPAAASLFSLSGYPSPTVAGAAHNFGLKAMDAYGNQATGYVGTAHFTSSDAGAALPGDYTFTQTDAGARTFSATLNTVATQSLTATDMQSSSLTGKESGIVVNPASLSFSVSAPSSSVAGASFNVTVNAVDSSGNVYTGYRGSVHFTSTDSKAVLPADYTYTAADAGVHVFSVTLKTAGSDSITVTDTASSSMVGNASVVVTPAAAKTFKLSGYPSPTFTGAAHQFTVKAFDTYGNVASGYNGTVHFTSSDLRAILPADYTFTQTDGGAHTFGATLNTVAKSSLTATDTLTSTLTGSQTGIVATNTYTLLGNVTPSNPSASDSSAVELGVRFRADVSGTITGIRFYKGKQNTGTHVAHLWSSSGTLLATATFSGESASGWQQVKFSKAVAITAGTTYVASYHTNVGHYAYNYFYFNNPLDSWPLHAPAGNNGVFIYGSSGQFPNQSFENTNYYVDVQFTPASPAVASVNPANGATNVSRAIAVAVTFNQPLNSASVNSNTVQLLDGSGNVVNASVTYDATTWTATITPTAPLAANTTYQVVVHGGNQGILSLFGQILASDFTSTFTTGLV